MRLFRNQPWGEFVHLLHRTYSCRERHLLQHRFFMKSIDRTTRAFSVHTRRGKLLRVSREQYLRTDLGCGTTCYRSPFFGVPQQVDALPKPETHENGLLVLDKYNFATDGSLELNVPVLSRIIVMETVLQEVRNLNSNAFSRLESLIKSGEKQIIYFSNEHHKVIHKQTQRRKPKR